jgi:hypothetical protein
MRDREEIQDRSESELDIEEIDNSSAPKRLRSRPRELTQIDREEGYETPPLRPKSERTAPSEGGSRNGIKEDKILQIAALIIMGILLLSNILIIHQINAISNRQRDIESNISLLINKNSYVLNNLSNLKEKMSRSNMDSSAKNDFTANLTLANLSLDETNVTQKNIGYVNKISNANGTKRLIIDLFA